MQAIPRRYLSWTTGSFCLLLISAVCFSYFDRQARIYFEVCRIGGPPWWYKAPQSMADITVSRSPGTTLSYFNYKFEVPWMGVKKEQNEGRWSAALFDTGQEVRFTNPDYLRGESRLAIEPESETQVPRYERLRAILSITPSGLWPLRSHRNFRRNFSYWERKGVILEHTGATDIFDIQTREYKGFEISSIPYNERVSIILFDAADREFQLAFSIKSGSSTNLTQPEINRVIESFGPLPD